MGLQTEKSVGLTTVYVAEGMLRAIVVQGALESAGIPVMLNYESASAAIPLTVGKIGQVKVMVPSEWAEEAKELLEAEPRKGEVFSVPPDLEG
jgi:hypothetical protein